MKTSSQLTEEHREVSGGRILLTAAFFITLFLGGMLLSRAGDIAVSFPDSSLPLAHRQKAIAVASVWDAGLSENGLTGISSVITFKIKIEPIASGLAWTNVVHYAYNSRGQVTVDGAYPVSMSLNANAGATLWSPEYTAVVMFHEMGHALGFSWQQWAMNSYLAGSGQYVGPALFTYRESQNPLALWIPILDDHYQEPSSNDLWYNEIMTTGISQSQWPATFIDLTTWSVCGDNGWTLNPTQPTGLLSAIIPARRLKDEDSLTIKTTP